MDILHRDDLTEGGFAGLREYRLVTGHKTFGTRRDSATFDGIGNFVYLADARFNPRGETGLHPHREVDVISIVLEGRISHEGSLEHGQQLQAGDVQVQRAGGEGFSHNEVNPDNARNRMLQLWVLPERAGEAAGYKTYRPDADKVCRIYGGEQGQQATFDSHTFIDVVEMNAGQLYRSDKNLLAYVSIGQGLANGEIVTEGSLIRSDGLELRAGEKMQLIVITADAQ